MATSEAKHFAAKLHHQPRRLSFHRHVSQHELDPLEIADRLTNGQQAPKTDRHTLSDSDICRMWGHNIALVKLVLITTAVQTGFDEFPTMSCADSRTMASGDPPPRLTPIARYPRPR